MAHYRLEKTADYKFSRFHAVYARENIFLDTDWRERLESAGPAGCGCLLYKDEVAIGGAVCKNGAVTSPFLIPPFSDMDEYWRAMFEVYAPAGGILRLERIPGTHAAALTGLGAQKKSGQYRMMRPTEEFSVSLDPGYRFVMPSECEKDEIIRVIYEAHCSGYTSVVNGRPAIEYVRYQTGLRFSAFTRTDTFDFGTIAVSNTDGCIAGVCLAGIYPDSLNEFATIHQVSVHPRHRRRGLARAMILNSISKAYSRSPVVTLGVLEGNPAMKLYKDLGFVAGCEYGDYEYRKQ